MEANNNTRMLEFRGWHTEWESQEQYGRLPAGKPHTAMPNSFVPTAMPMQPASAKKNLPERSVIVRAEAVRNIRSAAEEDNSAEKFTVIPELESSIDRCGATALMSEQRTRISGPIYRLMQYLRKYHTN